MLEHLPGLCGLTAPSFNSYHRIVPQYWAGAFRAGATTTARRRCACRRCSGGWRRPRPTSSSRPPDATCNPYLAIGGLIAAGLDGIERGLEPPEPVEVDPATLPGADRERLGIPPLPRDQREALDALAADAVLTGALGPVLAGSYLAVRRSEWETYSAEDEAFEQQRPLREVLSAVALVDHHAHGIVAPPGTLDEFRGLFSESDDPRQWPHVATGVTYLRAMRDARRRCWAASRARPRSSRTAARPTPDEYAATLLRATGTEWLLHRRRLPGARGGRGLAADGRARRLPRARP